MFEIVQFVEHRPGDQAVETRLGESKDFEEAVHTARTAWQEFETAGSGDAYAWWVVREPGAQLARWIADNHSHKEFAVDVRSGVLVEIRSPAG
jgi:precorrin-6x reductase